MDNWIKILTVNPIKSLLSSRDDILTHYVERDLLDKTNDKNIYNKEIDLIIKRQQSNGSWIFRSSSVKKYPSINHNLVETFKSIRILVGKYEMDKSFDVISKCADYIFDCQTSEGDFRGILGNQYMPYYCGLFVEYLIRAGYEDDERITQAMNWLISSKQNDGGWVVPLQTVKINKLDDQTYASDPIIADKSLPFSHLATGMVLRAFAVHSGFQKCDVTIKAAELIKSRFFKSDNYNDRKSPGYWTKFQYPYWWTTLLSSLDSLYDIGFTIKDRDIEKCIEWLLINQDDSGLWTTAYDKGDKDKLELNRLWIGYNICKILKLYLN
ncbi:MAG: hypothetical protein WC929_04795 [Bacilli bacterium]|jgi:hypothetical protein